MLRRLGITQFGQWLLNDVVSPVAIVDSSITLQATALSQLYGVPATAGELVAPGANTRLADTGPLAAGNYSVKILVGNGDAGGGYIRIRRRNAADAADIWVWRVPAAQIQVEGRFSLANNERLVVENPVAGGAGVTFNACIWTVLTA